jgi:hypothetical protein
MGCPKIVNNSTLRLDDIKRFVETAIRSKGAEGLVTTIEFRQTKREECGGWAYTGPKLILIELCEKFEGDPHHIFEMAQILEHEIDHILGLEHKDMIEWFDLTPTWHQGLQLRERKKAKRVFYVTQATSDVARRVM